MNIEEDNKDNKNENKGEDNNDIKNFIISEIIYDDAMLLIN